MNTRLTSIIAVAVVATAWPALLGGQGRGSAGQRPQSAWNERTPWGEPDFQGEWTTEGEYGVPMERPAQYGTRAFLTDEEYARRVSDVRARDERDLAPVDVLSGTVDGPNAPIPHWREYHTTSR